jgi:hypothetical protein
MGMAGFPLWPLPCNMDCQSAACGTLSQKHPTHCENATFAKPFFRASNFIRRACKQFRNGSSGPSDASRTRKSGIEVAMGSNENYHALVSQLESLLAELDRHELPMVAVHVDLALRRLEEVIGDSSSSAT